MQLGYVEDYLNKSKVKIGGPADINYIAIKYALQGFILALI